MASKTVIGACPHDCPDTCSMLMNVEDDRLVSVRGNPAQPFTRGRLCVKVNNYEDRVYSDARVLYPLRRTGVKGSGQFVRMTWKDALAEIGSRWKDIIDAHGPQSILPYSYLGAMGILNGLTVGDPFFNHLGATISERTFCDSGSCTAYAMTVGHTAGVDPESFVYSKFIILWACNTISTNSHHWPFIREAQKKGGKVVVIDPVETHTARKADWHIRIRPGTDAALALALINVIIQEGLTDDEYIGKYTTGYEELKQRAAGYTPERAAKITSVPADEIRELARAYAHTSPTVIRIGVAIERHAGGGQAVRAISCLPALVGSWRYPGGGLLQLPLWSFPINWGILIRPDLLGKDVRVLNQWKLGQALTGELGMDPAIKSLFVYNSNPVAAAPEQEKVVRGLRREELFTVVSEQFLTDTARFADIVLPATTQAEQEDIMFSWGHFYLSYNNKAIKPLGEAVPNTELFRRLAQAMGFDDPFFYRTDEQMIRDSMLWDDSTLTGITPEHLKKTGFARLKLDPPAQYAPHAEGNFPTPSGKCEFKTSLAQQGNFILPLFRQGYDGQQPGDPVDPLPHYIPPRQSAATGSLTTEFPLSLISPKSHAFLNSSYGNLSRQLRRAGEQSVIIHPEDAQARGIELGQRVKVNNDAGGFEAVANVSEKTMPGVVVAPAGHWRHTSRGGSTVQSVLSSDYADLGRAPTFSDVMVQVEAIPQT